MSCSIESIFCERHSVRNSGILGLKFRHSLKDLTARSPSLRNSGILGLKFRNSMTDLTARLPNQPHVLAEGCGTN